MRITILSVSVNPHAGYDMGKIAKMSYDEAKKFFQKDKIKCCCVREYVVDQSQEHEATFHAEDVSNDADTMLNWIRVERDSTCWL